MAYITTSTLATSLELSPPIRLIDKAKGEVYIVVFKGAESFIVHWQRSANLRCADVQSQRPVIGSAITHLSTVYITMSTENAEARPNIAQIVAYTIIIFFRPNLKRYNKKFSSSYISRLATEPWS